MNELTTFIAYVCDPYLALFHYKNYLKFWKDDVDEVLVNVNGRNDQIREWIADLWRKDSKCKFVDSYPQEIRQGGAFNRLYPHLKTDLFMTVDSDNFIYKKGVVSELKRLMVQNNYGAIGSVGHHIYPVSVARKVLNQCGIVRFNPFMGFFRKAVADKINNLTFESFAFDQGEKFGFIDSMPEKGYGEVMSKFTLQYRAIEPSHLVIWHDKIGDYIHVSGLSSIFRRFFMGLEQNNEGQYTERGQINKEKRYWIAYYLIYEATKNEVPFKDYNQEYERGFEAELKKTGVTKEQIIEEAKKYKEVHKGLFE